MYNISNPPPINILLYHLLQDDLVLSHWRRVADEGQAYPYARFNKLVEVPTYTKEEYEVSLADTAHMYPVKVVNEHSSTSAKWYPVC